ncbi:O-antigen ligase family protein [Metabacillus idriensis]|uniref:Polysaccharide polymerase n=1 Tax=Metabacillus idriensis TaxID=324768 RepID=A0A6I2MCP3_9BACI|nr:O-antigen ligase family protein [Metabacillus idriensis]MCM3598326.1 O-antigen ligase family protein [Metabacillus idriensis]MRX55052.1 polysaccharide polymerase [Metabacillus idriensis]
MDYKLIEQSPRQSKTIFFLILLVTLAKYNIYLGFALKPYMFFLVFFLIIHVSSFYFQKFQLFEILMLAFYCMYSFTGAFSLYPESSIRMILGISLYIFCYLLMKFIIGSSTVQVIEKSVSSAGIVFNLASLSLYIVGLQSFNFIFEGDGIPKYGVLMDRDYPRLIGLLQDPNFFIFYNTLFFSYYLCNSNSVKNKIGLTLCILTSLLTFSRGGLISLILIFLLYALMNNPIKQLRLIVGLIGSLTIVAFIAVVVMDFDIFGILGSRVSDFSSDGGSGRFELWGRAVDYFSSNVIFGLGAYNFADYNTFEYGDILHVHNTFLDILSESGLLGFCFYLLFVFIVFVQLIQSRLFKIKPYLFITFVAFILQMMSLSLLINDMFFLYLAILSTYLNEHEKFQEQHKIKSASLPAIKNSLS